MSIPPLPPHPHGLHWNDNVHAAYAKIRTSVDKAQSLLRQDDGDPARLHAMLARLQDTCVPLLEELEKVVGEGEWSNGVIGRLGLVMASLDKAAKASQNLESRSYTRENPVSVEHTGRRGRPRKRIDQAWLEKALSPKLKLSHAEIARKLEVHVNTVKNYAAEYGIDTSYSEITDEQLDELLMAYKLARPTS
ncbi:hypothetical protein PENSPDRAFT_620766, partial [Peniophora sp. CONT]